MAYDVTVPNASNLVRGATGDIAKMRANFEALQPLVQSGLNALLSGGTAASGDVAVAQGTGNAQWHYTSLAALAAVLLNLGDLADVSNAAPSADDVLKWNGSAWAPAADVSGAGGGGGTLLDSFAVLSMTSGGSLSVASGAFSRILSGGTASAQTTTGGWTISTTSGIAVVPTGSGIDFIRVHGQVTWSGAAGGGGAHDLRVRVSGLNGETVPLYFEPHVSERESPNDDFTQGLVTPLITVTGGELVWLEARHNDSSPRNVIGGADPSNGRLSYMAVQAYSLSGAGGGGLHYQARLSFATSQTQSVADDTVHTVTGMTERVNVGGWTTEAASGTITVPVGSITHIEARVQTSWGTGNGAGYRDVLLAKDGISPVVSALEVRDRRLGQTNAIQSVSSPLIPVVGGEVFTLQVRHTDGAPLNIVGGTGAQGGLTYLDLRGFVLTSGT